jgi:hypothetical protein
MLKLGIGARGPHSVYQPRVGPRNAHLLSCGQQHTLSLPVTKGLVVGLLTTEEGNNVYIYVYIYIYIYTMHTKLRLEKLKERENLENLGEENERFEINITGLGCGSGLSG